MVGDAVVRVVVVAEGDGLARALKALLGSADGIRVVGPVQDARTLADGGAPRGPAIAVADLDSLDGRGMEIVSQIREKARIPVLVHVSDEGSDVLARALTAGACGVLPCGDDHEGTVQAIRRAAAGELVLPDRDLSALVDHLRPPADRLDVLTVRERQTLHLLAEGFSTQEVAAHLGISPATVQTHIKNVLAKLGVHSKVQAVRVALLAG